MSSYERKAPPQKAPSFDISPEELLRETVTILEHSRSIRNQIAQSVSPSSATFENVIIPLAQDDNTKADRLKIFIFLGSVSTSSELREASRKAEKLISQTEAEFLMREDIFVLVDAVFQKYINPSAGDKVGLDTESIRLLRKKHREYLQNGLNIPLGTQRERFITARSELEILLTAARKALTEVDDGIWLPREHLLGVPEGSLATMDESKEDPNMLWVTFRKPHFTAVMQNCTYPATRRRMWFAKENRFPENVERLKKIVILRGEIARLLGFENHAELKMTEKIAKSVLDVRRLIQLRSRLAPLAEMEIRQSSELKIKNATPAGGSFGEGTSGIYIWDWSFYDRMLKEQKYELDNAALAEYFEVMNTMKGMLGVFEMLFGMRFEEVKDKAWEKDVIIFTVWNDKRSGSCFLGRLYVDLFLRKGKYDGASHHMLQPGYTDTQGVRHYPSSALVCNFTKPSISRPTLLRHNEVRTFFHELGHCIHNIVSHTTHSTFHGTHVARDFIEIPSIMLENWVWVPEVLRQLGRHYSYLNQSYYQSWRMSKDYMKSSDGDATINPDETIPDRLLQHLLKTKGVNSAVEMLKQIHLALFDLAVHTPKNHDMAVDMDISGLWNNIRDEVVGLASSNDDSRGDRGAGQAGFPHIFRKYDAGYFAYPLSKICAADLFFATFKDSPMDVDAGTRYRSSVLEPGSSRPELESLELFLGRKPTSEAYYLEPF